MRQYKIYRHPGNMVEAVKVGWSWPGFLFSALWCIVKRLWDVLLLVLFYQVVLSVLLTSGSTVGIIFGLLPSIVLGVYGNRLRERRLLAHGYVLEAEVQAKNGDEAVAQAIG